MKEALLITLFIWCASAIPINSALFVPVDYLSELPNSAWTRYRGNRSVIIGAGTGPGLPTYQFGETVGSMEQLLRRENLPHHTHTIAGGVFVRAPNVPPEPPGEATCVGDGTQAFFAPQTPNGVSVPTLTSGGIQSIPLGHPTCSHPLFVCSQPICRIPHGALVWSAIDQLPPGFDLSNETTSLALEPGTSRGTCWGKEQHALSSSQLPLHNHLVLVASSTNAPSEIFPATGDGMAGSAVTERYTSQCFNRTGNLPVTIGMSGSSAPLSLRQPYLGLTLLQCANETGCDDFVGLVMASFELSPPSTAWSMCAGQQLSVVQNMALFQTLQVRFGGNGVTTFGLPDLRGRTPIPALNASALNPDSAPVNATALGESGGRFNVTMLLSEMPAHNHVMGELICDQPGTESMPSHFVASRYTSVSQPNCQGSLQVGLTGSTEPFSIMQPSLALNYFIRTKPDLPQTNTSDTSASSTPTPTPSTPASSAPTTTTPSPSPTHSPTSSPTQPTSQPASTSPSSSASPTVPVLSHYQLLAPQSWSAAVAFTGALTIKLTSLDSGPWVVSPLVNLDEATLVLDVTGLDPTSLDGFTLQLIQSPEVHGQFTSVTVVSDSSSCPLTATISPSYVVTFLFESCTDLANRFLLF